MNATTVDQPQVFKEAIIRAIKTDPGFTELRKTEPYKDWNVQVTVNFMGGEPRKVEITKLSRKA